ncbi:MAG: hypothetical protein MUF31_11550 [Akkermansiaceae bacterium]|jgi:hypothetical protein|nr:hypothetical protein [Akkermansiaceae bacterium]
MFRLFSILLVVLTDISSAAEEAARTCRILFLNAPEDAPERMYLFDGLKSQEVDLARMSFSPVYRVAKEAKALALVESEVETIGQGTAPTVPKDAPVANLADEVSDFYLIVTHDASEGRAQLKMQVIRADGADFKRGSMLWYNLTENKVGGQVGKRKLLIQGHSREVVEAPAEGMEDYHVSLYFQAPDSEVAEPLCETNWSHDPRSRTVYFVIQPTGSMIPRVLGFPDFRVQEEQE